jgi:hypothetical protein
MGEPFWNMTDGYRPVWQVSLSILRSICAETNHVYDDFYGPNECARCGYTAPPPPKASWWKRLLRRG